MEATKNLVKWAHPDNLRKWHNSIDSEAVIPLADLTELVEGLEGEIDRLGDEYFHLGNTQGRLAIEAVERLIGKLKAQLEVHRKEGADGQ